ncbi:MAG: efflux RND transporter permease subunit [Sandaracinaceae bacterium]
MSEAASIERIVRWSVERRRVVLGAVALLVVAGVIVGSRLRFDALPDVTGRQVVVLTNAPGLNPEEVERLVTRPIELALGGLPGLSDQRSISRYGISSVTALFDPGTDLLRARQLVQERLQTVRAELPPGIDPPELGPLTGGLGEVYHFTLSSEIRTTAELRELVELRVSPLLRTVPGVVEVNTWGGAERTYDVIGDPARMSQRSVTLAELEEAVRAASGQVPGATLPAGEAGVLLRGVAWPEAPADLAAAVVHADHEGVVRIGDVAEVVTGHRPRIGTATADGRGETVYVLTQMLLDANALEVVDGIHARMPDVRAALPDDVTIRVVYDRSELVEATLHTVLSNLAEGGVLVVIVLFLLLGSFRAGAIVASVIPLSMLGATLGMVALDIPGNLMSLGALDFGLLVDGAVVMVEAVFFATHTGGSSVASSVESATRRMARPVFFSVLIILLVYVPLLSLSGVEGAMFRPMVLTVVLALASALVLSLTYVPAMSRAILRDRDVPAREPLAVRAATRAYLPVLDAAMRRPALVLALAVVLLGLGGWLFARAGSAFVPQLDEGDLVVQTVRASDIRVESAAEAATHMEAAILAAVPEVRHVASRTGSPAVATDIMGLEQADVFIDLAPRDEWRDGVERDDVIAEIERAIEGSAPPEELGFTQPIQMRFNELVGGEVSDVALSLYGEDLATLRRLAERASTSLERIAGIVDVRITAPPNVLQIDVRPRPLDAARHGLRMTDVLAHVEALRSGVEAGTTYDGPIRIPIRVRLGADPDALRVDALPLPTERGSLVPLARVADVRRRLGPSLVNHHQAARRIVIGFNVRGRDLGSVADDARAAIERDIELPAGYRTAWGGQIESLRSAQARLAIVIPVVLVSILALLWLLFRRLRPALVILTNVPFAAVGGIVALTLRGLPISISAAIGFIALSGIAVLNGVVLVEALGEAQREGTSPREAAERAARARMRPVLMTALVAALGFVPMMLATGVGAEVQRPLATVVVGGLVTSTLLTLVILPALYAWLPGAERAPSAPTLEPSESPS